jgi:hypothetical protein
MSVKKTSKSESSVVVLRVPTSIGIQINQLAEATGQTRGQVTTLLLLNALSAARNGLDKAGKEIAIKKVSKKTTKKAH